MRATTWTAILLLAAMVPIVDARGQQPGIAKLDPAARAAAIARFIDDQTPLVIHLDLAAVDPQATVNALTGLMGVPKEEVNRSPSGLLSVAKLAKVGATDAYFVFSLAELPIPGFLLITGKPGIDAAWVLQIATQWGAPPGAVCESLDGQIFLGSKATLERLKRQRPAARPELAKAFEAAGDSSAQVLFLPSDDSRRVVEELLPKLPAELGGTASTVFTRGVRFAAVGVDLPPKKLALHVVVQSQDAAAAGALRDALAGLYGKLIDVFASVMGPRTDIEPLVRNIRQKSGEIVPRLTPRVQGDRLVLDLSEENGGLPALVALVEPPVEAARAAAQRSQSFNNLKQLALAMHNYYDAKKSFPPAASYNKNGKPLLSWRVHLLPYLEQEALYREFHLDEPWDSEHNRKLIEKMPQVFRSPLSAVKDPGRTTYLLPVDSKNYVGGRGAEESKKGGPGANEKPAPVGYSSAVRRAANFVRSPTARATRS